jgi:hypothetical protein
VVAASLSKSSKKSSDFGISFSSSVIDLPASHLAPGRANHSENRTRVKRVRAPCSHAPKRGLFLGGHDPARVRSPRRERDRRREG